MEVNRTKEFCCRVFLVISPKRNLLLSNAKIELLRGTFSPKTWPNARLPRVHLYGISQGSEPEKRFAKVCALPFSSFIQL
jgi:hypothetical protein